ncbi:hypothetical protein [Halobacillus faecis]|nr:hypothetical protein [Halobacillus faecis]
MADVTFKKGGYLMNKTFSILFLPLSFVFISCSTNESGISEKEAKAIVVEHHTSEFGEVEVTSVTTKFNKFIVEWENKGNCESGTDTVNGNGEVKTREVTIC